jgi:hypothetical protein
VETLDGDPARAPLGLQVWVGPRIPAPEEARTLLGEHGVVCRVGELISPWRRRVGKRSARNLSACSSPESRCSKGGQKERNVFDTLV